VNPARSISNLLLGLALAFALALCLLSGCATLPASQPGTLAAAETGQTLLAEWLRRSAEPQSLQGVAKVRVQTAQRTLNGTQVLLVGAPDRLRAETLSPFGTPLLVLAANGKDLAVLLPGDNLFYRGRANPENLGRFTRLPLRLADLVGILLSRPPLLSYQRLDAFALADGGWRIELEDGQRRQLLHFDASLRLLDVHYLAAGELQLRLAYGDYAEAEDNLPRRIDLELPLQQTRASLLFNELQADPQLLPALFVLEPPRGATVIGLDDLTAAGSDNPPAGNAATAPGAAPQESQ
jgi:outer membrane lipoprotein-sorting protein